MQYAPILPAADHLPSRASAVAKQERLECVLALARRAFDMPFALIREFDGQSLPLCASAGFDDGMIGGEVTYCHLTVAAGQPTIILDTLIDERLRHWGLIEEDSPVRFYAGIPLLLPSGECIGTLALLDTQPRTLDAGEQALLSGLARIATEALDDRGRFDADGDVAAELARNALVIRNQAASVVHYKKMYDRSSALAKIGVWECNLADSTLTWTDGVYDIFELPRGTEVTREMTLALYEEPHRYEMSRLRAEAIRTCGRFSYDARIRTAKGNVRWMRLTADVESENGVAIRIFGSKQDITRERALWEQLRTMAERDPLTGLANRGVFQSSFYNTPAIEGVDPLAALALIDLDGFKQINDTYGHSAGDECLRQTADRLETLCEGALLVARIGGDELAILFGLPLTRDEIEEQARAILQRIEHPIGWFGRTFAVSASIGIAMVDPDLPIDRARLFAEADSALYAAKAAGRNSARTFERGGVLGPVPDARQAAG